MEIEFAVAEIVKLLSIVNNWPLHKAGEWKLISALGDALELTDAEREGCQWQEAVVRGQRVYVYDAGYSVTRTLEPRAREALAQMVQNPPPEVPWHRPEFMLYESLLAKLGVEASDEST
jgi:hypothetical protein